MGLELSTRSGAAMYFPASVDDYPFARVAARLGVAVLRGRHVGNVDARTAVRTSDDSHDPPE